MLWVRMYKIVQKKNKNAVYASGFWARERAEVWLTNYNAQQWTDKSVKREDLEIVATGFHAINEAV